MPSECAFQAACSDSTESEREAMDDDDGIASVMSDNGLDGPSSVRSSISLGKRKSRSGIFFRAWSFQMIVKADFPPATTTQERRKLLTEHLRARTGHDRPKCVTCVAVFCDESLFSGPTDGAGLVLVEIQGYVQAKNTVSLPTMQKWIESASWKPVPGGLMSDPDFLTNMRRFEDPNDAWTQLMVFGGVGANNAGRLAERQARRVGCLIQNYLSFFD